MRIRFYFKITRLNLTEGQRVYAESLHATPTRCPLFCKRKNRLFSLQRGQSDKNRYFLLFVNYFSLLCGTNLRKEDGGAATADLVFAQSRSTDAPSYV